MLERPTPHPPGAPFQFTPPDGDEKVTSTPSVPCHSCGLAFAFTFSADGSPMVVHQAPECAAFEAISDTGDAVTFSRLCRAKTGDFRP